MRRVFCTRDANPLSATTTDSTFQQAQSIKLAPRRLSPSERPPARLKNKGEAGIRRPPRRRPGDCFSETDRSRRMLERARRARGALRNSSGRSPGDP